LQRKDGPAVAQAAAAAGGGSAAGDGGAGAAAARPRLGPELLVRLGSCVQQFLEGGYDLLMGQVRAVTRVMLATGGGGKLGG
jgi:hypothetical protein